MKIKYSECCYISLYDDPTSFEKISYYLENSSSLDTINLEDDSWEIPNGCTIEDEDRIHMERIAALVKRIFLDKNKKITISSLRIHDKQKNPTKEKYFPEDGNHRLLAAKYLYDKLKIDVEIEINFYDYS